MFEYSGLEKFVDENTPDWIVSCSKVKKYLGWEPCIDFKGCQVHKAKFQDGKWTNSDNRHAYPDFMVLYGSAYTLFRELYDKSVKGYNFFDPLNKRMINTSLYIEIFGDYWHSGGYTQGLSKEDHQKEVEDAYKSAGKKVLVLWEHEIRDNWQDVCLPKLESFLKNSQTGTPSVIGVEGKSLILNEDVALSLKNPEYFRNLTKSRQDQTVADIAVNYSVSGYPFPSRLQAENDFSKFMQWTQGVKQRPCLHGQSCLDYYIRSITGARVKGCRSLSELWEDQTLMEKCIRWQLNNETGTHHAKRFLSAMLSSSGFRKVSNFSASKTIMLLKNHTVKDGLFFDPCAGWGGRLLASHGLGMKYVGIDANLSLVKELNEFASHYGIEAEIHYGDSSDLDFITHILKGRKVDLCFTSPPYFNKELYSSDPLQSVCLYPSQEMWEHKFLFQMCRNVSLQMKHDGVFIINLPDDIPIICLSGNFSLRETKFDIRYCTGHRKERLIYITPKTGDSVTCAVCGLQMDKLGIHIRKSHNLSVQEYKKIYGIEQMTSRKLSEKISRTMIGKKRDSYQKKVAYLLKDGRVVRRKNAWFDSWGPNPPEDSIVDGKTYDEYIQNRWHNKIDGTDYVCCALCGFKGANISRHVREKHGIDVQDYKHTHGPVYCTSFAERRFNPWSQNKS